LENGADVNNDYDPRSRILLAISGRLIEKMKFFPSSHFRITPKNNSVLEIMHERRKRFRILVCLDGSEGSFSGLKLAANIGHSEECDIILLYVRAVDQGIRSEGLQGHLAHKNMLDWGIELPGIDYLKKAREHLIGDQGLSTDWITSTSHTDSWGDPLGDNKVEYHHKNGRSIVLKLKTAPDVASGILDQYELGPYNMIIMGAPSHWHSEVRAFFGASVAQKVSMLAPCSVLLSRPETKNTKGGHLICVDGTRHSLEAMRRDAILAHSSNQPVTLLCVAESKKEIKQAERVIEKCLEILIKIDLKPKDTLVNLGHPQQEILKIARDYAITVIADSRKTLIRRLFSGGTSLRIMGNAQNSVLIIR
jgi:nucleotide-binding universal stress UspA family protein